MRLLLAVVVTATTFVLTSCGYGIVGPSMEEMQAVKRGMSGKQVHKLLGDPARRLKLSGDGGIVEVWAGLNYQFRVKYLEKHVVLTEMMG